MILITGDFNGRVGEIGQLETEISIGRYLSHGRKSKDTTTKDRGEDLLTFLETQGMILFNGRSCSDSQGNLTFISKSITADGKKCGSVIDLMFVDVNHADKIIDLEVTLQVGLDHIPVITKIAYQSAYVQEPQRWQYNFKEEEEAEDKYKENIQRKLRASPETDSLTEVITVVAEELILKTYAPPPGRKPWFDQECREQRKTMRKTLRKAKTEDWNPEKREEYQLQCKKYKRLATERKRTFWQEQLDRLNTAERTQQFWKEIRKFRRDQFTPNGIEGETWVKFYSELMPTRPQKL